MLMSTVARFTRGVPERKDTVDLGVCWDMTVPFCCPYTVTVFLPFQTGKKAIPIAETVAKWKSRRFAKQTLRMGSAIIRPTWVV